MVLCVSSSDLTTEKMKSCRHISNIKKYNVLVLLLFLKDVSVELVVSVEWTEACLESKLWEKTEETFSQCSRTNKKTREKQNKQTKNVKPRPSCNCIKLNILQLKK